MEVDEDNKDSTATAKKNEDKPKTNEKVDEKKEKHDKKQEEDKDSAAGKDKKDKREPEPNFEILQNPARVVRQQLKVISVAESQTYKPLEDVTIGGIIVMQHTGKTDQELVEPVAAYEPKNDDPKEPELPEPFEYTED